MTPKSGTEDRKVLEDPVWYYWAPSKVTVCWKTFRSEVHEKAMAVLGFCVWGLAGGYFCLGATEGLSAEGAKLQLPKARRQEALRD